ncbi:MAG: hypothetical protein R3C26_07010 [Calditrichia bacterium]
MLRDILPDSVLNAGDTLSFAIGDLLPSGEQNRHGQSDGERSAVRAVPVGEHDHRDRRQCRSRSRRRLRTQFSRSKNPLSRPPRRWIFRGKCQTDSFTVNGTDTTWFAEEDETYSYNITVRNTGTLTATSVLLRDVLPDSVLNAGDTLSFAIGDLAPSASRNRHDQPDGGE